MFSMVVEDCLCLCPPMKWVTKWPLNSLKVETVFRVSLLNDTPTGPFSVVGNALHIISSGALCRCMRVLNDFRWLSGSLDPSYVSTYGIRNFAGKGKDVTSTVNGESVRWTSSSKLVDTCPFMAFMIMSIFSFIICMSSAMRIALTSIQRDGLCLLIRPICYRGCSLPCLPSLACPS